VIAALLRRFRARKARAQVSWMAGYVRDRYGQRRALENWARYRP
jgi:hypothetical protein